MNLTKSNTHNSVFMLILATLVLTMAIVFLAFGLIMSIKMVWLPALTDLADYTLRINY